MTWPLECSSENSTLDDIDLIRLGKHISSVFMLLTVASFSECQNLKGCPRDFGP